MNRATDITSFSKHRRLLRQHLDQAKDTGRPIFITTNGETDGVLLGPDTYDALVEKAELIDSLRMVDLGVEQYQEGQVRPVNEAVHEIAELYGKSLPRPEDLPED